MGDIFGLAPFNDSIVSVSGDGRARLYCGSDLINVFDIDLQRGVQAVVICGTRMVVVCFATIQVWLIDQPWSPVQLWKSETGYYGRCVAFYYGGIAVGTLNSIDIYDASFAMVGTVPLACMAMSIDVLGECCAVALANGGSVLVNLLTLLVSVIRKPGRSQCRSIRFVSSEEVVLLVDNGSGGEVWLYNILRQRWVVIIETKLWAISIALEDIMGGIVAVATMDEVVVASFCGEVLHRWSVPSPAFAICFDGDTIVWGGVGGDLERKKVEWKRKRMKIS